MNFCLQYNINYLESVGGVVWDWESIADTPISNYYFIMACKTQTPKRCLVDEFDALSAGSPSKRAKVEGILTVLSPMKSGKMTPFFDGRLMDNTCSLRVVGFDKDKQQELAAFQEKKEPITLENCQIVQSRYGTDMEVLITKGTKLSRSPKQFDNVMVVSDTQLITLDKLSGLDVFKSVNVRVKVIQLNEPVEIKPGLSKQDLIVADATFTALLTLWQNDVNKLEVGKSYALEQLTIQSYNNNKTLSPPKFGKWTYSECEDIEVSTVATMKLDDERREINDVTINGILSINSKSSCLGCKANVESLNDKLGKCVKCNMIQRLDKCLPHMCAKLLVTGDVGEQRLVAYTPILSQIICHDVATETEDDVVMQLLVAESFHLTYTSNYIINSIHR